MVNIKIKRFDVCLVNLDPTIGSEIRKTSPAVIISPDSMNLSRLKTVIIAPLTSTIRESFPTRVRADFKGKEGQIALDQLRSIDRARIVKKLGKLESKSSDEALNILSIMSSH